MRGQRTAGASSQNITQSILGEVFGVKGDGLQVILPWQLEFIPHSTGWDGTGHGGGQRGRGEGQGVLTPHMANGQTCPVFLVHRGRERQGRPARGEK